MEFVQIIEYQTSKIDELRRLLDEFRGRRAGSDAPAPTQIMVTKDRDRDNVYLSIVRFGSYEEAMENSNREDTSQMAQRFAELCDRPPTFRNLDVIQDESLVR